MVVGIVKGILELQKSARKLGFKILEIEPTSLKSIKLLCLSPAFLKDGDGNWEAPSREHGRIIGIKVIKAGESKMWWKLSREERRAHTKKVIEYVRELEQNHGNQYPQRCSSDIPDLVLSAKDLADDLEIPHGLVASLLIHMRDNFMLDLYTELEDC